MVVYYTFGRDCGHPYEGGWVKIAGEGGRSCDQTFRALYPDKVPGRLRCAGRYTEWEFLETVMPEQGNLGAFCHAEHIQPGEVEHRMEAAVDALCETDAEGPGRGKVNLCQDCGAPVTPPHKLCDACREIHKLQRDSAQNRRQKEKRLEGGKPEPAEAPSIAEVQRAAAAAGMSYGKYVQLMAAGKAPGGAEPEQQVPPPAADAPAADSAPGGNEGSPDPPAAAHAPDKPARRTRAQVTPAVKAEAVRAVLTGELTLKQAAADAGVKYHTLWEWVDAARRANK